MATVVIVIVVIVIVVMVTVIIRRYSTISSSYPLWVGPLVPDIDKRLPEETLIALG